MSSVSRRRLGLGITVFVIILVAMAFINWILRTVVPSGEVPDGLVKSRDDTLLADRPQSVASGESGEVHDHFTKLRFDMVQEQLRARGRDIHDERVLRAMQRVPRHKFVSDDYRELAYMDRPLPIGKGQTISQPYIVALMTQLVQPKPNSKALDVGTGSGYQAAVLAELVDHVYTIEIVPALAAEARDRLDRLQYRNVTIRDGDGYRGWAEEVPFDVIIVAAAPDHIPQPLIDQLAPDGSLIIPVGRFHQQLIVVHKTTDGSVRKRVVAPVAFVPMTGEANDR